MIQNINRPENKIKRVQYLEFLHESSISGRTLIWIDETNFNLYYRRSQLRSKIGWLTRSLIKLPSSKGANLHCTGAINDSKMLLFTTQSDSFKSDKFNEWIKELIGVCSGREAVKPTLIIDNTLANARLEAIIERHENAQLLVFAPYSHLLNPIEPV